MKARRAGTSPPEVAWPEAIRDCHDGGTHRAVLVCALRPGKIVLLVDPKRETHVIPQFTIPA
jgi:hypothetical protein